MYVYVCIYAHIFIYIYSHIYTTAVVYYSCGLIRLDPTDFGSRREQLKPK